MPLSSNFRTSDTFTKTGTNYMPLQKTVPFTFKNYLIGPEIVAANVSLFNKPLQSSELIYAIKQLALKWRSRVEDLIRHGWHIPTTYWSKYNLLNCSPALIRTEETRFFCHRPSVCPFCYARQISSLFIKLHNVISHLDLRNILLMSHSAEKTILEVRESEGYPHLTVDEVKAHILSYKKRIRYKDFIGGCFDFFITPSNEANVALNCRFFGLRSKGKKKNWTQFRESQFMINSFTDETTLAMIIGKTFPYNHLALDGCTAAHVYGLNAIRKIKTRNFTGIFYESLKNVDVYTDYFNETVYL
jgi:hypothetical protein